MSTGFEVARTSSHTESGEAIGDLCPQVGPMSRCRPDGPVGAHWWAEYDVSGVKETSSDLR